MNTSEYVYIFGFAVSFVGVIVILILEYIRHHALIRSMRVNQCKPIEYMMYRYEINIAVGLSINRNLTANKQLAILYKSYAELIERTFEPNLSICIDDFHERMKQVITEKSGVHEKILNVFNEDIHDAVKNTLSRTKYNHNVIFNPREASIFIQEWLTLNNVKV